MQKGQPTQWGTQYAVGMPYAVGVSAKRSTHTVDHSKYGWWGPLPLVQKGQPMQWGMQYTVGMQYAVGVSAKRSTHTLDLAIMGGGDRYL